MVKGLCTNVKTIKSENATLVNIKLIKLNINKSKLYLLLPFFFGEQKKLLSDGSCDGRIRQIGGGWGVLLLLIS